MGNLSAPTVRTDTWRPNAARSTAIAEYLHYASAPQVRVTGISILQKEMQNRQLYRYTFPLTECVTKKLSLIHIYNSQFLQTPQSIDQFTPATDAPNMPHEAIWNAEKMDAQTLFKAR